MVTKKDLVIVALATFCLTATLFLIIPTRSSPQGYDPWLDVNDDGKINILDLSASAIAFGSSGDPTRNVNVTNWPKNKLAISVSQFVSASNYYLTPLISLDGYSKFTVCFDNTAPLNGYRLATTHLDAMCVFYADTQYNVVGDFVKTYDATDEYISVYLANMEATTQHIELDIYLIA